MDVDLDAWLPNPQVRNRHRRSARADADRLWQAAAGVRVRDAPMLGRAVRWRIPDTSPDLSFHELFRTYPFTAIAEGGNWSVSALCGRIWTVRRDYPRIEDADAFLSWDEPGTVRVLLAHWVEPDGDGRSALVSESRIQPVDAGAGRRLRALWAMIGGIERFVGGEALGVAVRRAEADR